MKTINVLFFSVLQDIAGESRTIDFVEDTLGELLDYLYGQYPDLRKWDGRLLLAVNQEFADRDEVLKDGDEIAIMPPVQGG